MKKAVPENIKLTLSMATSIVSAFYKYILQTLQHTVLFINPLYFRNKIMQYTV